jgi:hypothetical protein
MLLSGVRGKRKLKVVTNVVDLEIVQNEESFKESQRSNIDKATIKSAKALEFITHESEQEV